MNQMGSFLIEDRWMRAAWYVFLILLPFTTRVLLGHVTRGFHEYEALFLYGTDVLLLLLLLFAFGLHRHHKEEWHGRSLHQLVVPIFLFVIAAGVSVAVAPSFALSLYAFARLFLLTLLAWWAIPIFLTKHRVLQMTVAVLAVVAVIQAFIGIAQFSLQGSLGLELFGESYLDPVLPGAGSKIPFGAGLLRAYGTFPHPNILGAFLLIGLFALIYFYVYLDWKLYRYDSNKTVKENWQLFIHNHAFYSRLIIAVGFFVVLLGLAVTFSRGAWISALAGLSVITVIMLLRHRVRSLLRLLFTLFFTALAVYWLLSPVLNERAQLSSTEPAVSYRLVYNQIGTELVDQYPLGVGVGSQVLHSVRGGVYQAHGLSQVWEWEPIHNLYLLIGSEVGIVGLLSFLFFLAILLWQLIRRQLPLVKLFTLGALVSLLVFGLFDHFLWTIQPGRLMLWVVIGIAVSQLVQPQTEKEAK